MLDVKFLFDLAVMRLSPFSSLPLSVPMLQNLETLGYHEMTPVQAMSLPFILKNQDIIAKAKTGSGKTAAFGLGILSKLNPQYRKVQSLVICPTRELADQVGKELRRLARFTPNICILVLCGGKPLRAQEESLRNGAHIIVGTPGRLQAHIEKNTLNLHDLKILVLDEADRMLDMGFYDNIMDIIKVLPIQKQTLLFSATYPNTVEEISHCIQKNPIEIIVESQEDTPNIKQIAYEVRQEEKNKALIALLYYYGAQSVIIFCKTKRQCDNVAADLYETGFHTLAIHSDLEQRDRDEVLLQFSNQSCSILVATDVAARGLDIKDVQLIINYDLPLSSEIYVHRIGRTGRAGKSGVALSLFSSSQRWMINEIEEYTKSTLTLNTLESLDKTTSAIVEPPMCTLCINGGKKNKVRPGDILGALTGDGGLASHHVGKIDVFDYFSYVAIDRLVAHQALAKLQNGKIKGRAFKIRIVTPVCF